MNFKLILFVGLAAIGFAMTANAGSIDDTDGDSIPDVFDNCRFVANGPNENIPAPVPPATSPAEHFANQLNTNAGGEPVTGELGNVCDADFNDDGVVDGPDFSDFLGHFNSFDLLYDLTGDGVVDGPDFSKLLAEFNKNYLLTVPADNTPPGATAI